MFSFTCYINIGMVLLNFIIAISGKMSEDIISCTWVSYKNMPQVEEISKTQKRNTDRERERERTEVES